jgi:alpha-galactosidase
MSRIGFGQDELSPWAKPGHWNDPDMLEIGNGAMSDTEYRAHMSLWAMLAAPLIAGNDLRSMTPSVREILMNREVIAVDQDPDGKQGKRVWKSGDQEIWLRQLAGGAVALGLFNRSAENATMTVAWADIGIKKIPRHLRDLWAHSNIESHGPKYSTTVPGHSVVMLRVSQ